MANGGNVSVVQGNSANNSINATLLSANTQNVTFSVSGLPSGATGSFAPTNCSPNCSTVLTINTTGATPAANSTVTVTATGGGVTRTTAFTLTVTLPPVNLGWRDSTNGFHSFLVFEPNGVYSDSFITSIAPRYDFGWSARYDNALLAGNPQLIRSYYNSGTTVNLSFLQANHPDWITYKCDRVTPVMYGGNAVVDITNPAVIDFKFDEVRTTGDDPNLAVALDNFFMGGLGACGVYDLSGNWVQKFNGDLTAYASVTDPQWTDALINFGRELKNRLHGLNNLVRLIVNTDIVVITGDAPRLAAFIDAVDGVLIEGTSQYDPIYVGDSRQLWLRYQRFVEAMQAQGKAVYSINYPYYVGGTTISQAYIQFVLASYFLSKGSAAGLYIPDHNGGGYFFNLAWRPEFDAVAPIGSPCDAMFQSAGSGENGVWMRQHTGGVSIVNPSASGTFNVALPAGFSYRDLYGNNVGATVTMAPGTGLVLLKTTGTGCS